jgi:glycosyltransferase involved in cell wall biosynthesis
MHTLLNDDGLCLRMGKEGRRIVESFSVEKIAKDLLDDYMQDQ